VDKEQTLPSTHAEHDPPPQSVSVSKPFLTPSVQIGDLHRPAKHTRELQSDELAQAFPSAHFPQVPPPQSTSVSAPFFMKSKQVAT